MRKYKIEPISSGIREDLLKKIDGKTKPVGSLGVLERIALQVGMIQNTLSPELNNPHILVYAADHGIAREGISPYCQEVTWQMVLNFLQGGAAINVFCCQSKIQLLIVDAGVNYDFPHNHPKLVRNKIKKSTENFLHRPAMSVKHTQKSIDTSANIVRSLYEQGCNIIGFGEMGIGNTASASALMSVMSDIPIEECVGREAGLDTYGVREKQKKLLNAIAKHGKPDTVLKAISTYGGFEIAQMVGGILQAAELKMIVLIDGFISTVAFLLAKAIEPDVKDYCFFCHQSSEHTHRRLLSLLDAKPLLDLEMRLGEGTGAAVAYPIIQSAVNFLNQMASFEYNQIFNSPRASI
jgi:nicotinate-nucleotide--dimethylbenzimidazole phosphoribosyltransferase